MRAFIQKDDGEDEREEGATPGRDRRRLAAAAAAEEERAVSEKNGPSRSASSRPSSAGSRATRTVGGGTASTGGRVVDPVNTLNFLVVAKYVRREIRGLTDRDRETFFNAVSIMQRVPSAVGQQVYGSKYYSKDFFNRIHLYYGTCMMLVLTAWRSRWTIDQGISAMPGRSDFHRPTLRYVSQGRTRSLPPSLGWLLAYSLSLLSLSPSLLPYLRLSSSSAPCSPKVSSLV